ncbi:glycosyltransferase [bacterium]|nr:glycosyltransferase [bacterium]
MNQLSGGESVSVAKQITVCIPLRITRLNVYLLHRLSFLRLDSSAHEFVNVLVVDDGSKFSFSKRLQEVCSELGYEYKKIKIPSGVFSIGRCRNFAARHAKTRYVFFQDVDLIPPEGFYKKLNDEILVTKLQERNNHMIMIPVSYLTEAATESYLASPSIEKAQALIDATIMRSADFIVKFSTGTSACLYDRYFYLSCGGNDEDFSGWGFEDLEFNTRMIRHSKLFPLPDDFSTDIGPFDGQYSYRGWKSVYRLFGDRSLYKGVMLFHASHPIDDDSRYMAKRDKNKQLFIRKLNEFGTHKTEPVALACAAQGKTLLFRENAFTFNRRIRPFLGEIKRETEDLFPDIGAFRSYVESNKITRVMFHNPYATTGMQNLFSWCRELRLSFVIAERGALNDSIFYDTSGFLADSKLFAEELWNRPLDAKQTQLVEGYVLDVKHNCDATLEAQGGRYSESELREKLNLTRDEKLILVCFQRPSDTATRFFRGPCGGYSNFVSLIKELSEVLPSGYRLACKTHPLEDQAEDVSCDWVDDVHLYDLFAVASKVIVFNSGAGLQALVWGVPVITCGDAFYSNDRFVTSAGSCQELLSILSEEDEILNGEYFYRFLHYLLVDYYSFGTFSTRSVRLETGERITATTDILFSRINFEGIKASYHAGKVIDSWSSMLFDRYRYGENHKVGKSAPGLILASSPNVKRPNLLQRIYVNTRGIIFLGWFVGLFKPLYEKLAR